MVLADDSKLAGAVFVPGNRCEKVAWICKAIGTFVRKSKKNIIKLNL